LAAGAGSVNWRIGMKRDLDLVRELLLYFESKPTDEHEDEVEVEGFTKIEVDYHLLLLEDAGLLRCERLVSSSTPSRVIRVLPFSLTWKGHEFLEASREESGWRAAKEKLETATGALSFDLLRALLIESAKKAVGLDAS
jgi:hypothetical protein